MSESTKPEREEVNDVLDSLEDSGWVVRDYNPYIDPHNPLKVTLTIERTHQPKEVGLDTGEQRELIKTVKGTVEELAEEHKEGAPIVEVIELAASEADVPRSDVKSEIEKLKQKGEVYEPRTDHLKAT